jgi:hypothetical protein
MGRKTGKMKLIIKNFPCLGFILCLYLLVGCKKDTSVNEQIIGVNWILNSGRCYVDQLEAPFAKTYYDHFGPNQQLSTQQAFDSLWLPIDSLKQHSTSWMFASRFVLNQLKYYDYEVSNERFYRIYGLENGSARIAEIRFVNNRYCIFRSSNSYGNYQEKNITWFNELIFSANGQSCGDCVPDSDFGYSYSGILPLNSTVPTNQPYPLSGTTWLLEKYQSGLFQETVNDTLHFIGPLTYTINSSSTVKNYSLTSANSQGIRNFSLYELSSLPGASIGWTAQIASNSISDGIIEAVTFSNYVDPNQQVTLWMHRLN